MPDRVNRDQRRRNMQAIKSKDMKPEMVVRRLVHGIGYRYRLHANDLPGRPDLVFRPRKKVIFVHGCFWHQHNAEECRRAHTPKSNTTYWYAKLERNSRRDRSVLEALAAMGWSTLVIWECETGNLKAVQRKVIRFLE